MLAWLAPIWSIGSFDSCVHMSEEAMHASKAVPLGIVWSAGSAFVLGFLVLSVIAATMNPDVSATINTKFGQPMAQIYYDAFGRDGALGFMAVLCVIQFLIGLSLIVAASRQAWAFSRDGALPFSRFFRHVSKRIQYQPVRMICGLVVVSIMLGLLCLINSAAANALFSLFVASNYLSWGTPIFCRLVWGEHRFTPGEFYTGRLSRPIAWVAVVYLIFGVTLSVFPTEGPNPTRMYLNTARSLDPTANNLLTRSIEHELHHSNQRLCLVRMYGLLFPFRTAMVHWTPDDCRRESFYCFGQCHCCSSSSCAPYRDTSIFRS